MGGRGLQSHAWSGMTRRREGGKESPGYLGKNILGKRSSKRRNPSQFTEQQEEQGQPVVGVPRSWSRARNGGRGQAWAIARLQHSL